MRFSGTLDVAVASAARDAAASGLAEPVVLLSPACASFDQYRNFEIRGDALSRAGHGAAGGEAGGVRALAVKDATQRAAALPIRGRETSIGRHPGAFFSLPLAGPRRAKPALEVGGGGQHCAKVQMRRATFFRSRLQESFQSMMKRGLLVFDPPQWVGRTSQQPRHV